MADCRPIGFFDSGIGGTSIWKEVHQILPSENSIYLSDSINAPYGEKSKTEILNLCIKNVDFLLEKNCKLIVVACNTATTNAIRELRQKYDIPFIGIEPAIKPAVNLSKTHRIGILATKGTLTSELFHQSVLAYADTKIIEQIGHGLVELIEKGAIDSEEMQQLLKQYLNPMIDQNIDYLVLGCSHYPYLIESIKKIIPNHITVIDSGQAVAQQTKRILEKCSLENSENTLSQHIFYTNSDPSTLQMVLKSHDVKIIKANF